MPLISGGLFTSAKAREIIYRLANSTRNQIVEDETVIQNDSSGIFVIAGREEMESSAEKVQLLSDGMSLFAGRLFSKDKTSTPVVDIPIEQINNTKGHFLSENYWGRYLLVHLDTQKGKVTIYRDPQGLSTIFYMQIEDGILFSTEVALLYDALEVKPSLNWKYLTSFVAHSHNITNSTPFIGIMEALSGSATELSIDGGLTITDFWDPTAIKSTFIHDEKKFTEDIYQALSSSTKALSLEADKIVVELSGGLDSSSVLSVLKDVIAEGKEIAGVNYMHAGIASSNEIKYAQEVAELCNIPLTIVDSSKQTAPINLKTSRRFNRPSSFLFNNESHDSLLEATAIGSQGEFMCGQGGDHLFITPPQVTSIADYILEQGINGLGSKISEISTYHRMPYFTVLSTAIKRATQYKLGNLDHIPLKMQDAPWMTPDFKKLTDHTLFKPLFWDKLKNLSPGKAQHIFSIYQASHYLDRGHKIAGKQVLNPLLSQPLVELAISMPTYQSFRNGYDRSLFRSAIDAHKKGKFIWRKSKGETSGILILLLRANHKTICKLLLNGHFAQKGLLDKNILQESLIDIHHGKVEQLWLVLNLIVAEIWLKSWGL